MRRYWTAPAAALLLGALGGFIRWKELNTSFEEATGLPKSGDVFTTAIISLTAVVAIVAVVFAILVSRRRTAPEIYRKAFYIGNYGSFALSALLGIAGCTLGVVFAFSGDCMGISGYVAWVFYALMIISGLSVVSTVLHSYTQKEGSAIYLTSVLPSIFFCYWMVLLYRENAGNPTLLEYCFSCYGFAAAALSFYYMAGYIYGRGKVGPTICFGLISIYLLIMTVPGESHWSLAIFKIAMAVYIAQNTARFIAGLSPIDSTIDDGKDVREADSGENRQGT